MQNTTEKSSRSAEGLYKFFIYFVLVLLAVTIIVPVAWVFMASIKQNAEFYGNPWALPAGFYWQNFINAWNGAKMGEYMLNSVIVTALALALLLRRSDCPVGGTCNTCWYCIDSPAITTIVAIRPNQFLIPRLMCNPVVIGIRIRTISFTI